MDNTSYSSAGFRDRGIEEALDGVAAAGFPQVEVQGQSPHVAEPLTGQDLVAFRRRIEARGLRARSIHAPAGRAILGAPDEEWRKRNMELLGRYLQFAGELGATEMVVHPVPNPIFVDDDGPETPQKVRDAVPRSLDDLVPVAEAAGVRMTLENLPYHCAYPYLTMKELRPLVDDYPEGQVGLILDSGHVGLHDMDPAEEIRTAGSRLRGTHLHDVDYNVEDGDHRAPEHGGFDWGKIREALIDIDYPGPWTFEVIVPNNDEPPDELARITRDFAVGWGITD